MILFDQLRGKANSKDPEESKREDISATLCSENSLEDKLAEVKLVSSAIWGARYSVAKFHVST